MRLNKLAAAVSLAMASSITAAQAHGFGQEEIKHVLLISVDGLHALDVARYVESRPNSTLAELTSTAITR